LLLPTRLIRRFSDMCHLNDRKLCNLSTPPLISAAHHRRIYHGTSK
jgi:hypothetical protein